MQLPLRFATPFVLMMLLLLTGCSRGERAAQSSKPPAAEAAIADHAVDSMADATEAKPSAAPSAPMSMESAPSIEAAFERFDMGAPEDHASMPMTARAETRQSARPSPTMAAPKMASPRMAAPEMMAAPDMAEFDATPMAPATATEIAPPQIAPPQIAPPQIAEKSSTRLPAGARQSAQGFATVQVFYATDRQRSTIPMSAYQVTGQKQAFVFLSSVSVLMIFFAGLNVVRGRSRLSLYAAMAGGVTGCLALACVVLGQTKIEKHGVTYTGDRGVLTRGICEVTVPDSHQRGMVERPSLLRFEIREDQEQHIVLTSAVELSADDFQTRLSETVSESPNRDMLVFIHGYNVDFDSAVRRTAQIAVDLPFEGVPVCYSWPSQGSLIGYSIDANNAEWTVAHLKQFLLELATESGAESINVVAHSMGNRAMTAAMQQIGWQLDGTEKSPFDRVVLAAPDVDADRFRRDFAPSLLRVANQVTLYASSDDQALVASKQVHGYPRAGESGANIVVVPGVETVDVSGIDLSLLGHSYYGDNESMLRDLYEVVRARLPASQRASLTAQPIGSLIYWKLAHGQNHSTVR